MASRFFDERQRSLLYSTQFRQHLFCLAPASRVSEQPFGTAQDGPFDRAQVILDHGREAGMDSSRQRKHSDGRPSRPLERMG